MDTSAMLSCKGEPLPAESIRCVKRFVIRVMLLAAISAASMNLVLGSQGDGLETLVEAGLKTWDAQRIADIEQGYLGIIRESEKAAEPSLRLGTALNNLGLIYFETARYSQAEPLFRRAIPILEKVKGKDHPVTAG